MTIDQKIEQWAQERGLDKLEFDYESAKASQYEELGEYYEAYSKYLRGDSDAIYDIIDASCDQYIYAAVDLLKKNVSDKGIKYLTRSKYNALSDIRAKGFDSSKCIEETIKEISSRTGQWSDEHKKWVKDTSDEARVKWYKADYSKCRL